MGDVLLYVGPPGGSDERGAKGFAAQDVDEILPLDSLEQVISTVDMTEGTLGSMAMEDSLHGEFSNSLAEFIRLASNVLLIGSYVLAERIDVVSRTGAGSPTAIASHPAILEQLAGQLRELDIRAVPTATTDAACSLVGSDGEDLAALAPKLVSTAHGLVQNPLLTSVTLTVRTRYGLLGRTVAPPTGADHTLLLLWPEEDRPGTLQSILSLLADHSVDLVRLESQFFGVSEPHGFLIEAVGHLHSVKLRSVVEALISSKVRIRALGALPQGDPVQLLFEPPPVDSVNNSHVLFRD